MGWALRMAGGRQQDDNDDNDNEEIPSADCAADDPTVHIHTTYCTVWHHIKDSLPGGWSLPGPDKRQTMSRESSPRGAGDNVLGRSRTPPPVQLVAFAGGWWVVGGGLRLAAESQTRQDRPSRCV